MIIFYDIVVRVTSSAKAFIEVVDVLIKELAEELVLRSLRASPFMRPFIVYPVGDRQHRQQQKRDITRRRLTGKTEIFFKL